MKREIVSIAVMLMLFVSMFLSLPLVSAAYTVEYPYMPPDLEGDVNNDGMVDMADITIVIDNFMEFEDNPVAYSTTFDFNVPEDVHTDQPVNYYVLARVYMAQELSAEFVATADDRVQNVKLDDVSKAGSGPSVNIDLGTLSSGYHLLEFEFVDDSGGGSLNFHVATTEEYAWLTRFRVYVPNYSEEDYKYTVKTHTYFPHSDDYFLIGYADDYIDDVKLGEGELYNDWEWDMGEDGAIYAWGDGFCYPLGYFTEEGSWKNTEFVFG